MSDERRSGGTLGDVLAARRRRRFVGRDGEVELFRAALDVAEPPFSVLHVHGPGGIGKTSLMDVYAALAAQAGRCVVRLDGRDTGPSRHAVARALGEVFDASDGDDPVPDPSGSMVVLLDSYERLAPLDDWVRTALIPRLPSSTLTVIAGRAPPGPGWRADPAWHDLLRVVSLRNLTSAESCSYLRECGVESALHDRLVAVTHGHPLGLSLLADVVVRGGAMSLDSSTPDVVGTLLRRFVDVVPSSLQRRALGVCALARVTSEPLLRAALPCDDAHDVFEWLRGLSFIESGPDGLFPHDLARHALDADLRWRDPDGYKRVFRSVRAHIYGTLKSSYGHEQRHAIFGMKFLFRNLPSILSPVEWSTWGAYHPEPARADDRGAILELVEAAEGGLSAAIAERWLDRQAEGFFVVRADDGAVRGFVGLLNLTAASAEDRVADPGAQAAWNAAHRQAPPRRGEVVTQSRFIIDREAYQSPSPTLNATPIVTIQRQLQTPNLAWDFLTLAEPELWDAYFALADMPRAVGADFEVGDRRFGLYCHDFRVVPIDSLMELWTERALAQDFALPAVRQETQMLVLSQPDFTDAVRQALRDLHRPDLLARNPLLRTRLVHDRTGNGEPHAAVLHDLLREAVDALRQHPRDDKMLRAVERTYVRPRNTQEAAAAALGLPFSTYRRHLTHGVERIVSWLWEREVYGTRR
ncbi:MAG TPA: ATP-binding protein [Euzebyales bacterium]|nr:ATP-binding protein [Euzebyales bacterium]